MNIDILTENEVQELKGLISDAQHIVICCHKSPDGDALGSSLAWAEYLRQQGKEPLIAVPDAYPDFLHWQPGVERVMRYDHRKELIDEAFKEADLVFCLDFSGSDRLDIMQEPLDSAQATKVVIDHHLDPTISAALTVSRSDMSSTSELVFRIIWQLGGFEAMDKKMATTLYSGMMCDTGGFTYNSNRPDIFFIVCQLMTKGINKDKIYRNVYNNFSPWAIRLRGYLMSQKLNSLDALHASYYVLTKEEMHRFHYVRGDQEGLVNEPLRIKGMKLSISLREDDRRPNTIWVSLRSVDDFPCNKMAARFFNGGGHLNASGGRLNCSVEEAEVITRNAINAYADVLTGKVKASEV